MGTDIRDLVRHYLPNFPVKRVRRCLTDTTDFTSIGYGDVIHVGGLHYMVLRDEAERRFGIEDFKFWVKRCKCLETGEFAILKLVFHEEFVQELGPVTIRSFRSEIKEARILELVKDDPRFMHGFSVADEAGNLVRVLSIIRGRRLDMVVQGMAGDHREYFDQRLRHMLELFVSGCEGIGFLHDHDELHGDVRRDHLWFESGTGTVRWIDFDYACETGANPFALDLFGLGNALLFVVGKQIYTPQVFNKMNGQDAIEPNDFSLIYKNRLVNLRRLFPYIPEKLNKVLMYFAAGSGVYYESVNEFLDDLRPCIDELPIKKGGAMNFMKILLAVDASENAMRAVEYVGHMVAGCNGFEVQILCIERLPHRDLYPDEETWTEACETTRAELSTFMETAGHELEKMGLPPEAISKRYVTSCLSPFTDTKPTCSRGTGVAQDILAEVESGDFGTVVVGRRGVSKEEEFIFGSVSNKIVHSAKNCTVWVVS